MITHLVIPHTVCGREGSKHTENHSLDNTLIGGPKNVRAAECTQRFDAKKGHALFHSLFQRDDIVGRSLYERLYPQKSILL